MPLYGDRIEIDDYEPKLGDHTYSRQYFSNQLVNVYVNKKGALDYNRRGFKSIALLKEWGDVSFKTEPNLELVSSTGERLSVVGIKPILATKFHYYQVITASGSPVTEFRKYYIKSKNTTRDILDLG